MKSKVYNTEGNQMPCKVCESQHKWGGDWTVEKLDALEKYVRAYLTILKVQWNSRSPSPLSPSSAALWRFSTASTR